MSIGCVEQRTGRTNLNTVSALRTIKPAEVGADYCVSSSSSGFDGFFSHPFVANPRASLAEDASLRIISDHWR